MSFDLEIHLSRREGALLRALGVVQRRGWVVRELHARHQGSGEMSLALCVVGERGACQVLVRQLARLPEVLAVGCPGADGVQWVRARAPVS